MIHTTQNVLDCLKHFLCFAGCLGLEFAGLLFGAISFCMSGFLALALPPHSFAFLSVFRCGILLLYIIQNYEDGTGNVVLDGDAIRVHLHCISIGLRK